MTRRSARRRSGRWVTRRPACGGTRCQCCRAAPAESVGSLLAALGEADPGIANAVVSGLVKGWPKDRPAKLTAAQGQALAGLVPKLSTRVRGPLVALAVRWGTPGFEGAVARM